MTARSAALPALLGILLFGSCRRPFPPQRAAAWSPMSSGTTQNLIGIWGPSGRDVFIAGYGGTLLHYDGKAWAPMSSGTGQSLNGGWGFSAEDVFVVGGAGTILHYGRD